MSQNNNIKDIKTILNIMEKNKLEMAELINQNIKQNKVFTGLIYKYLEKLNKGNQETQVQPNIVKDIEEKHEPSCNATFIFKAKNNENCDFELEVFTSKTKISINGKSGSLCRRKLGKQNKTDIVSFDISNELMMFDGTCITNITIDCIKHTATLKYENYTVTEKMMVGLFYC